MSEPTQEQIKEFLQWCGIQCYYKDETNDDIEAWICPPDSEKTIAFYGLTLDFLFKYAVPKTIIYLMGNKTYDRYSAIKYLFRRWFEEHCEHLDFTLALFWALDKIRQEEK